MSSDGVWTLKELTQVSVLRELYWPIDEIALSLGRSRRDVDSATWALLGRTPGVALLALNASRPPSPPASLVERVWFLVIGRRC